MDSSEIWTGECLTGPNVFKGTALFLRERRAPAHLDEQSRHRAQITSFPEGSHVFSMESRAMSDKLLINLFGLTISADGIYAIIGAVIIVVVLIVVRWRPR